jgi:hypothetical protein
MNTDTGSNFYQEQTVDVKENHSPKVVVGFKCSPNFKTYLIKVASNYGLTLSAYSEEFMMNAHKIISQKNVELEKKTSENLKLIQTVNFYQNPILLKLFEEYRGKSISYKNYDGVEVNLIIADVKDVFTIIVNSFK